MTCYLRITGEHLDSDALVEKLKTFGVTPHRSWKKGDRPSYSKTRVFPASGVSCLVSDISMDCFDDQITDALDFMTKNYDALEAIKEFHGIEEVVMDFAIQLQNVQIFSDYIPPNVLFLLGKLGIELELSHYPATN